MSYTDSIASFHVSKRCHNSVGKHGTSADTDELFFLSRKRNYYGWPAEIDDDMLPSSLTEQTVIYCYNQGFRLLPFSF
jgi:hypothetical protein